MKKKVRVLSLAVPLMLFAGGAQAMSITAMDSGANMAQSLVGAGVTVSNVTYTGANVASGYFTGGNAAGIGIDSGIVLTSGFASHLNGNSNTSGGITGNNQLSGYGPLNALVPGYTTYDATILEFDFTSNGDAAYFSYVFGSDEYNEWVGSTFNDVFGFFLNGANHALIPGTSTPVSINNVNNGANSSYYNDNGLGAFPFEYDGFTSVLTASFLDLTPGETYHLALAIADAGDRSWDSGVFLAAGSFSDKPPEVPEPATLLLMGTGIAGLLGSRRLRRK